jgi:hypothetical protein
MKVVLLQPIPASGMTSTDIGIAESSTAVVGNSLPLIGKGTKYSDFTWEAAVFLWQSNKGQRFGDLVLPTKFIMIMPGLI